MTYEKIRRREEVKRWINNHEKELVRLFLGMTAGMICYGCGIHTGKRIQSDKDSALILSHIDKSVNDLIKDVCRNVYG